MKHLIIISAAAVMLAIASGCSPSLLGGDAFYDGANVTTIEQGLAKIATPVAVTGATGATNVVTITCTDLKGDAKAAKVLVRCWVSDTDGGAPAAVATNITVSTGVEVQQIVDKADYWVLTDATGVAVLPVVDAVASTNYFCTSIGGGPITTVIMTFDAE